MNKNRLFFALFGLAFFFNMMNPTAAEAAETVAGLPILEPVYPRRDGDIRNPITYKDLHNVGAAGDENGLFIALGNPALHGKIYTGPYPFEAGEADYDYTRYRFMEDLVQGTGPLRMDRFFSRNNKYNANNWPDGQGMAQPSETMGYRIHINGHGFYDGRIAFDRVSSEGGRHQVFQKRLTIIEGPFMTMLTSDDPTLVTIAFETDAACDGAVEISKPYETKERVAGFQVYREFSGKNARRHEIPVTGLMSNKTYLYRVVGRTQNDVVVSSPYLFKSASPAGVGSVSFAFVSDSREGIGGGERNYMGHNRHALARLALDGYRKGADVFLVGGDLVNGYTSDVEDFRLQLKGWKKSMAGFWRSRPVYPTMGNHEALLHVYDPPEGHRSKKYGISLDKWPYDTHSAEAVFGDEFWNPKNGPESTHGRPPYQENVYHFQYGPVLFIAFNNNYWWTTNGACENYGGSPEGYLLEDQLTWIEKTVIHAESNPHIRFVVLFAQEPVFPAGGHPHDAMWYHGNNNVRAFEYDGSKVVPVGKGIIEVRNRFWEAVSHSAKVAAVLAGDEHAYHRIIIDKETPVGLPAKDDVDGDGRLNDGRFSPNPRFRYPTWQITAGTAGAPFYAQQDVPWKNDVMFFSSQTGYCLFTADENKISMTFYTITGQALDHVDDLMAIK